MEIISCLLIFNGLNSLLPPSLGIASFWFTGDLKIEPGRGKIWLPKGIKWCLSAGYSLASVCLSVCLSPAALVTQSTFSIVSLWCFLMGRAAQQEDLNSACPSTSCRNSAKQVLIYI